MVAQAFGMDPAEVEAMELSRFEWCAEHVMRQAEANRRR